MRKILAVMGIVAWLTPATGHDIYTGVHGKDRQYCCSGDPETGDCRSTIYKEEGKEYFFLTREKHWIKIPEDRITFLPIPGDPDEGSSDHAHLCYRDPQNTDRAENIFKGEGQEILLYCAFIPPSSY